MERTINQLNKKGHTPLVTDGVFRGYRHAKMRHEVPKDTLVYDWEGNPIMRADGAQLKAGDCLPERVDIALRPDGKLYNKLEFKQRYQMYMQEATDKNIAFEHVPNPRNWIKKTVEFRDGEYRGNTIDIGADPTKGYNEFLSKQTEEMQPTQVRQQDAEAAELRGRLETINQLVSDGVIDEKQAMVQIQRITNPSLNVPEPKSDPLASRTESPQEAPPKPPLRQFEGDMLTPCGKTVAGNKYRRHIRACGSDECRSERGGTPSMAEIRQAKE